MNLFTGIGKKAAKAPSTTFIEYSMLEQALAYIEHLALPAGVGGAAARVPEQQMRCDRLLFFSDGSAAGDLNAGYMAGQAAAFLQFQGIDTAVLRRVPEGMYRTGKNGRMNDVPENLHCIAALVFEESRPVRGRKRKGKAEEYPCICSAKRENWSDELLSYTKQHYPLTFRRLRASRKDSGLSFTRKRLSGRKYAISILSEAFEAGVAASNIMAAADALWVELEFAGKDELENGCLFSVVPRQERPTEKKTEVPIKEKTEVPIKENTEVPVPRAEMAALSGKEQMVQYA